MNVLEVVWRNALCYQLLEIRILFFSFVFQLSHLQHDLFFTALSSFLRHVKCNRLLSSNLINSFWSLLQTRMHNDEHMFVRSFCWKPRTICVLLNVTWVCNNLWCCTVYACCVWWLNTCCCGLMRFRVIVRVVPTGWTLCSSERGLLPFV